MRIDGFEVTFTSFPEGRTYTPPKGCALSEGMKKQRSSVSVCKRQNNP